jgi:hypothetical protein
MTSRVKQAIFANITKIFVKEILTEAFGKGPHKLSTQLITLKLDS